MEKQPASNPNWDAPPPYPGTETMPNVGAAPYPTPYQTPYPTQPQPAPYYPPSVPVVMNQPTNTTAVIITSPMLGPYPVNMQCNKCQAQIVTSTRPVGGLLTWLIAGGLLLIGCWMGCCLIPFCVDELQDTEHRCPNCKHYIGVYKRM